MTLARVSDLTSRTFSLLAFGLLGLAVVEKLCNINGYTVVGGKLSPQNLLGYATILLMFVFAMLLRDIRDRPSKG